MSIKTKDPRMHDIVAATTQRETISEAFTFTEGPIWHPREGHLTFSDIPENKMYRYAPATGMTIHREPSNMANGNTYDSQGRMLSCEHATSRVVREHKGALQVLASHYEGKELNSPNDIVVHPDGSILFTDPTYGRYAPSGVERPIELDFCGVYRIDPAGQLTLLGKDFKQPNGLCLGLDTSTLFVADTARRQIRKFHLRDGTLTGGEIFCESPAPDGLKIDSQGYLYAGGPKGVYVYHPKSGDYLGIIETPAFCANFAWGDSDLKSLYLTASKGLYKVRVNIPGIALF